jgi:hypothetical protein
MRKRYKSRLAAQAAALRYRHVSRRLPASNVTTTPEARPLPRQPRIGIAARFLWRASRRVAVAFVYPSGRGHLRQRALSDMERQIEHYKRSMSLEEQIAALKHDTTSRKRA